MIELAAGLWHAAVRPEIGGCLAALSCDGVAILRTMASDADHALQSACFPLVPYCNRIAGGRFDWNGRTITIAPNLPPQPHPLHGLGWLARWLAIRSDATSALLEHAHDGSDEWPWPYVAHQHIALDRDGCTIRLLVLNRAAEPAPVGLGLHPYFRRSDTSEIMLAAETMLGIDAEFLPDGTRHAADTLAPWSKGARPPDRLVDNSFTGWNGSAEIVDDRGTITVRGFGTPHCHLYVPPGGSELCIEPANHLPDILNRAPREMPVVLPGCASGIAMRIEGSPH